MEHFFLFNEEDEDRNIWINPEIITCVIYPVTVTTKTGGLRDCSEIVLRSGQRHLVFGNAYERLYNH